MRLPDFVVLGQGKAGTSLIFRTLEAMPDIGLSTPKELHYFNLHHARGPGWYASHFAGIAPDVAVVGEVSPSYLREDAVRRVADTLGRGTKVIFVLRKPIEQNYARYLQNICANQEAPGFHVRIRPLPKRLERLEEAIALAYELFGPQNVLPLLFERDIAVSAPTFAHQIRSFLGLPPAAAPETAGRYNRSVMPRYLFGGDSGFRITSGDGEPYWIPARTLVFCAQDRNGAVLPGVSEAEVAAALARQSTWSPEVPEAEYAALREAHVVPAAERIMDRFGLDLTHWRDDPPRRLAYPPAPPPPKLRARTE